MKQEITICNQCEQVIDEKLIGRLDNHGIVLEAQNIVVNSIFTPFFRGDFCSFSCLDKFCKNSVEIKK